LSQSGFCGAGTMPISYLIGLKKARSANAFALDTRVAVAWHPQEDTAEQKGIVNY
jgi:hypothetical protein